MEINVWVNANASVAFVEVPEGWQIYHKEKAGWVAAGLWQQPRTQGYTQYKAVRNEYPTAERRTAWVWHVAEGTTVGYYTVASGGALLAVFDNPLVPVLKTQHPAQALLYLIHADVALRLLKSLDNGYPQEA